MIAGSATAGTIGELRSALQAARRRRDLSPRFRKPPTPEPSGGPRGAFLLPGHHRLDVISEAQ
jgi:hypothetical protein